MAKKKQPVAQKRSMPMWLLGLGLIVVLGAVAVILLGNPGGSAAPASAALPAEISVDRAAELREAGAFILDVREPDEWNAVHIPGATLIPLGQLSSRLSEVPKDQEVVVVCRSGNRSQTGRNILQEAGFTDVTSMAGGMNDWASKGYPTTSGP